MPPRQQRDVPPLPIRERTENMFLEAGQRVNVDVSGLWVPGARLTEPCADGVVVDVAPGVITVRLELEGGEHLDVTISPRRIGR
jgi:hypothetical protein